MTEDQIFPQKKIESFLRLIDTTEKRRNFLTDLCTLREYLDKMFNYEGSRFEHKKSHPAYRIMITANEIIGSLLLVGDNLKYTPTGNGVVVEVVGPRKYEETCPMPLLKSFREYKEYVKAMGVAAY